MLVNARLRPILVDDQHYSLPSQVILAINSLVLRHFLTDSELHLAIETEQDRMKLSLSQYYVGKIIKWVHEGKSKPVYSS